MIWIQVLWKNYSIHLQLTNQPRCDKYKLNLEIPKVNQFRLREKDLPYRKPEENLNTSNSLIKKIY